jgi:hypothetical protein
MAETAAHPYATHLGIKFDPLTLIDVSSLAKTRSAPVVSTGRRNTLSLRRDGVWFDGSQIS